MAGVAIKKNTRRMLIISFFVLLIVIAILIVGIIIISNKSLTPEEIADTEEIEYVLPDELLHDDLSMPDQVIKETSLMLHDSAYNNEDIENYYDAAIEKAKNNQDNDSAIRIIIQKMNFITSIEENCTKAKEYINNVDLSSYSTEEKGYLTSFVISMATECKDQELQIQWENL